MKKDSLQWMNGSSRIQLFRIYAWDVTGEKELTPVAIKLDAILSERSMESECQMDYTNIPTAVFSFLTLLLETVN